MYPLLVLIWSPPVSAQEYIRDERTAPESVEDLKGPIVVAFPVRWMNSLFASNVEP